jgi:hypothetical protein
MFALRQAPLLVAALLFAPPKSATLPTLPSPTLAVPDGNVLAFSYAAVGVQIYSCKAATAACGFAWAFDAPEASLRDQHGKVALKHFGGPTWQSVADDSTVVGHKLADFTANPKAIPELLLEAKAHTGTGILSPITFIQRLATTGGLAPTHGCDEAHAGAGTRVAYTAKYYFYRSNAQN